MSNVGVAEMFTIVTLMLLIFGPSRLPTLARQIGRTIAWLRTAAPRALRELDLAGELVTVENDVRALRHELEGHRRSSVRGTHLGATRQDVSHGRRTEPARPRPSPH